MSFRTLERYEVSQSGMVLHVRLCDHRKHGGFSPALGISVHDKGGNRIYGAGPGRTWSWWPDECTDAFGNFKEETLETFVRQALFKFADFMKEHMKSVIDKQDEEAKRRRQFRDGISHDATQTVFAVAQELAEVKEP